MKVDKALTKVSSEYADFADVFLSKLVTELLKHMRINDYTIELVDDQQFLYDPIYSLEPIKLETLKAYIENNLADSFIKPFKSLARASILFDKKPDGSLKLYVNY